MRALLVGAAALILVVAGALIAASPFEAQLLAVIPVVVAARVLPRMASAAVVAASIGGQAAVALTILPVGRVVPEVVHDVVFSSVVLIAITVLVGRQGGFDRTAPTTRLSRRTSIDRLTGLANRAAFEAALDRAVRECDHVSMVLLGLDDVGRVNDLHGRRAGDEILTSSSAALREFCRVGDLVARVGGDELAVLLPGCPPGPAKARAGRMVAGIAATPVIYAGAPITVTASVGVASVYRPAEPESAEQLAAELYRRAEAELSLMRAPRRPCAP